MSTQITFKKFTTWLFINYKVINVITGKSASPKDFDILALVSADCLVPLCAKAI